MFKDFDNKQQSQVSIRMPETISSAKVFFSRTATFPENSLC